VQIQEPAGMLPDSWHGGADALLAVCLAGEDVVDVLECVASNQSKMSMQV